MAAKQEVTFVISARDRTRAVFRRVRDRVKRLRVALVGLVGAVGLGKLIRDMLDLARSIDSVSDRLDISAETLQGLRIIAAKENVTFETLVTILQRFQRRAGEAINGSDNLREAFERIGVTAEELEGLNLEDLFFAIADGMANTEKSTKELSADLQKIGDVEALRLLGALQRGGSRLAADVNLLQDRGAIQAQEQIAANAERSRQIQEELIIAQTRLANAITETIPALTIALNAVLSVLEGIQSAGGSAFEARERAGNAINDISNLIGAGDVVRTGETIDKMFEEVRIMREANQRTANNTEHGPRL